MNLMKFALLTLLALVVSGCGCETVDTGHVGVVRHFGEIQPYTLPEGLNFLRPWPFASVEEISIQTGSTQNEAAGASKDLQTVHTKVTVQWSISPAQVVCIVQKFGAYSGAWTNGIMEPAVQEVVKAVSAKYAAEQLITLRAEVKAGVEQELNAFIKKTLGDRGCVGGINIANVAITNFEFSREFNQSIEAKVKAEQDALRAENEKRTRVTQAEASAKEKTLAAEAEAFSIETASKARAAAIDREAKALESHPELIQLRIAEKWNGVLPHYTGSTIPMLQIQGNGGPSTLR